MVTVSLVILAIIIILVKWYWDNRALYNVSRKIPGPISYPMIGNIGFIMDFVKSDNYPNVVWEWYKRYNGLFCGWVGPYFHIFVIDPEDIESTYSNTLVAKPPHVTDWWTSSWGPGLITLPASEQDSPWRPHKKILTPALAPQLYKNYYQGLRRRCVDLVKYFEAVQDKELEDVGLLLTRYCADAVTDSMYGTPMEFNTGRRDSVLKAFEIIDLSIVERSVKFWYNIKFIYEMSSFGKRQKQATEKIVGLANDLLEARLKQEENNTVVERLKESSVVGNLLKSHRNSEISRDDMIGEIVNMWAGGSETTGITMKFLLTCLAIHKEFQDKAFAEIKHFFKDDRDSEFEYEDLDKFPYLENCMKESMRLFLTGPTTLRYSTEEFLFKSKNIIIPPNVTFVLNNFLAHRNPKSWERPNEYDPERWKPENSIDRHPCCYSPFSGGPRKCPGRAYARIVIIPAMVSLLKKYEFTCPWKLDDIPLHFGINVTTPWGCKVVVTERKW